MPIDTPIPFLQLITLVGVAAVGSFARFWVLPNQNRWHDLSLTLGNFLLGILVGFLCRDKRIWGVHIFEISTAVFAIAGKEIIKWGILAVPMILNFIFGLIKTGVKAQFLKNTKDNDDGINTTST